MRFRWLVVAAALRAPPPRVSRCVERNSYVRDQVDRGRRPSFAYRAPLRVSRRLTGSIVARGNISRLATNTITTTTTTRTTAVAAAVVVVVTAEAAEAAEAAAVVVRYTCLRVSRRTAHTNTRAHTLTHPHTWPLVAAPRCESVPVRYLTRFRAGDSRCVRDAVYRKEFSRLRRRRRRR